MQVAFFLQHWGEIKKSDTMQNIWKQIRGGKHVGFEEGELMILRSLTPSVASYSEPARLLPVVASL